VQASAVRHVGTDVKKAQQDHFHVEVEGATALAAICDGHGKHGATIASLVCQRLPIVFRQHCPVETRSSLTEEEVCAYPVATAGPKFIVS
jgi:serine/threonine protein phosphatase PrpC